MRSYFWPYNFPVKGSSPGMLGGFKYDIDLILSILTCSWPLFMNIKILTSEHFPYSLWFNMYVCTYVAQLCSILSHFMSKPAAILRHSQPRQPRLRDSVGAHGAPGSAWQRHAEQAKLVLAQWPGRSHASRSQCHHWPKLWQHDVFWLVQLYIYIYIYIYIYTFFSIYLGDSLI